VTERASTQSVGRSRVPAGPTHASRAAGRIEASVDAGAAPLLALGSRHGASLALRSVAITLALFWSLQALVCLVPAGHAVASEGDGHASAHSHHHGQPEPTRAEDHGSHHSAPPPSDPSDHHGGSNQQCEQHCASLKQTLTAAASAIPAPAVSVAPMPAPAVITEPRALAGAVARLELARPPPDILVLHSTLRI